MKSDDEAANGQDPPASTGVDEDISLPRTTVSKLIAESLPLEATCSKEARDLLIDCAVQFIHLLASEANQASEVSTMKSITAEHLIKALGTLGFQSFIEPIERAHEEQKREQKTHSTQRKSSNKLSKSGLSEEELLRQQEELFKQARLRYEASQQLQQQQQQESAEEESASLNADE